MKRPFGFFTSPHHDRTHTVHPKRRLCRLESLERRDLLSAVPLSASEYAALTEQYSSLSLPETMDDLNVITLDLSEGDGLADLQSAIVKAAHTYESDLIVVRTTADANLLSTSESLHINIDSKVFGSLTIVGLGDTPLTLAGHWSNTGHGIDVEGNNTNVGFANLTITTCTAGIYVSNHAAVTITDCEITNCTNGIYSNAGTTTITDCVITDSRSHGIWAISGDITIVNCVIKANNENGIYLGGGSDINIGNL